jgi:outer membrane immunogenic protein
MQSKLLIASALILGSIAAASAADLPTEKGPPVYTPPPPPVFSWTGFYIGGQVGYQWGSSFDPYAYDLATGADVGTFPLSHSDAGVVGGAHAGYNYQINMFVVGIEGDVDGSNYFGSASDVIPNSPYSYYESTRIPVEGSIRGRVGLAFDRFLIYGTGGAEFGLVDSAFGFIDSTGGLTAFSHGSNTRVGWTAGGGVEYAIDNNWSVRAEYRYIDLGRVNYSIDPVAAGDGWSKRITKNQVTAGFSYKFGDVPPPAPPVVAKY